jgi:carbon monoxide dehydrogenase subunit G
MASIRREIVIAAPPEHVWDALRDVGNIHQRVAPGFLTDCRMDGEDARIVTFANGLVAREIIVDVDDKARRVVWSATGGRLTHHNGALQVFAEGNGTRAVWIADLLPHALADSIAGMIDHGMQAMKQTLEKTAGAADAKAAAR